MRVLKNAVKRLLQLALVLLVVFAVLWGVSRTLHPTAEQRTAITQMERWQEYPGENAFALLWTLGRAVPDPQLASVMAADVERFGSPDWRQIGAGAGSYVVMPGAEDPPSAANEYADLTPGEADRNHFCRELEADCLNRVRDDLDDTTRLVERNAQLIERIGQLQEFGYIRSEFPQGIVPLPHYNLAYLAQTRHAVDFAHGRTREAVAAACRDLTTWRRLGAQSDSLVSRMFGIAIAGRDGGRLLASMIAELPVGQELPLSCREALTPPADFELSMCNAMRGEFEVNAALIRAQELVLSDAGFVDRWAGRLFMDTDAALGMKAEDFLTLCETPNSDEAFAEGLDTLRQRHESVWRFECFGMAMNCVVDALSFPAYSDYLLRIIDHGAQLRALATLAWMRGQAGQGSDPSRLLDERPAALKVPADGLAFGPDGRTLQIKMRWDGRGETWSIPLPPALYAKRDVAAMVP